MKCDQRQGVDVRRPLRLTQPRHWLQLHQLMKLWAQAQVKQSAHSRTIREETRRKGYEVAGSGIAKFYDLVVQLFVCKPTFLPTKVFTDSSYIINMKSVTYLIDWSHFRNSGFCINL